MRLSRPCYDKPHRCPGWAGGGTHSAKEYRCSNGSIRTRVTDPTPISADEFSIWGQQYLYPGVAKWHPGYCNKCDVVTVPYALRWLDWQYVLNWRIKDWWRWKALPRLRSLTRGG